MGLDELGSEGAAAPERLRCPGLELRRERLLRGEEDLVAVQGLAGGGGVEAVGVDHGPDEERPVGQQVVHPGAEQHPLDVDPVPPGTRCDRGGQDERDAADAGERHLEVDVADRREAEGLLAVAGERLVPRGGGRVVGPPRCLVGDPAGEVLGAGAVARLGDRLEHRDVDRQQLTELGGQSGHRLDREPVLGVPAGVQPHPGSDGHVVVGQLLDLERPVVAPDPAHDAGLRPRRAGDHLDRVGDHERREHADAELADVLGAAQAKVGVPLGGAADRGEGLVASAGVRPTPVSVTSRTGTPWGPGGRAVSRICAGAPGSTSRRAVTASTAFWRSSRT